MKKTIQKLALGVTVAIVTAPIFVGASAQAGDWSGGLKGMRGTHVPVPAPVPIPDYSPKWYMRADVGLGLGVSMDASESGMTYGANDFGLGNATSPTGPFGMAGIFDNGHNIGHSIGVGAGYYFSPNFRMDITGELRSEKESSQTGQFQYIYTDPLPPGARTQVDGRFRDKTELQSAVFMANGYYDMTSLGRWKPYIGGGLGFAVNDVRRTHGTSFTQCDPDDVGPPVACNAPTAAGGFNERTDSQYTYSLAANLTAGVSYKISDVTSLDFNYRYLYVGGSDVSTTINGYNSKIEVADQHEHYLRAGLRFDIN